MSEEQVHHLSEIDRSEMIDLIYEMPDGKLTELSQQHECPNWDESLLRELQDRFLYEIDQGGMAIGAFDGETLVGFGVLAHQYRGENLDQLQIDLMYVSRHYRRQGIGTRIMNDLSAEAKRRGAKYLYISSTETRSAVSFYKHNGGQLTDQVDEELFAKEPMDIHMLKVL
ncbi:GNAT family N-acetyltransferase [Paenibacillus sp. N1-5-1-14]|uniref:GNAT family N-acetyltransferase n=1 Tax=Paenibacillus radicibacter TaxID=2972488 RepID=UPI00215973F0|nr:GNAT family N-acetyltransferase [Paenibacillus radicibacter]MCR8644413.1 GNAT family N-acetyltransferase [Paenibacillus radicibacter]